MSITDKYNDLVDSSKKKEQEHKKAIEALRFYEECGLGKAEDLYRSQERIRNGPYPEYVQEVVDEAVKLIHDDKWGKTDFKYSENDITMRSGERDGVYFFSLGEPFVSHSRTVKYKSPDGVICIGGFEINDYSIEVKTGGLFARQRIEKEIQEKKREYLKVISQTVENLSKVLYGDQSYVKWSFRARYDINVEINAVLFRDGYLFLNDFFGANGGVLENIRTGKLVRMNKDIFEDIMIENIRKINND